MLKKQSIISTNGEGTSKGHQRDPEGTPEGRKKGEKSQFTEMIVVRRVNELRIRVTHQTFI